MLRLFRSTTAAVVRPRLSRAFTSAAPEDPQNMVLCNVDTDGFATVTLNRPEVFNAFSDVVIARLSEIFKALKKQNGAIAGESVALRGTPFCIRWVHYRRVCCVVPSGATRVCVTFFFVFNCRCCLVSPPAVRRPGLPPRRACGVHSLQGQAFLRWR